MRCDTKIFGLADMKKVVKNSVANLKNKLQRIRSQKLLQYGILMINCR